MISRAIDTRFVVLCQSQAAALTWRWTQPVLRRVCSYFLPLPLPPPLTHALPCVCACSQCQVSTVAS